MHLWKCNSCHSQNQSETHFARPFFWPSPRWPRVFGRVCVVSLQCQVVKKAFSNSSATDDNERVKCSDLLVGLSLKVSSRLESWQTQPLLVAHATPCVSSFDSEILLIKSSTNSTQRSTKPWNSRPLPKEETQKGQSRHRFSPVIRLLGFGGPPVDTL